LCLAFIQIHANEVLVAEAGSDWTRDMKTWEAIIEAATGKRWRSSKRVEDNSVFIVKSKKMRKKKKT